MKKKQTEKIIFEIIYSNIHTVADLEMLRIRPSSESPDRARRARTLLSSPEDPPTAWLDGECCL